MKYQDIFDIKVGYIRPKNPVALAPMAGITDSTYAKQFADVAGIIDIGGYNLDEKTNTAARLEMERGRKEFASDDPMGFLESELESLADCDTGIIVNARAASVDPFLEASKIIRKHNAILEINAHCRQPEMKSIGVGESLLADIPRLTDYISRIKKTGVIVSVKTRANVVNDTEVALAIESAGADIIHIDAVGTEGADVRVIRRVRNATGLFIIGNNSVTDFESAKLMFSLGADMVSVGRAVVRNPETIRQIADQTASVQLMTGWYNAPKHICAGGDLRALAFCCMPVKPCALHSALKQAGLTKEEFMKLKLEFAKDTPIQSGEGTCFGSMTWCCKITKPCFLRDGALETAGLSDVEYMQIKKRLSGYILSERKNKPINT